MSVVFRLENRDRSGRLSSSIVIVATGLFVPNIPPIPGIELAQGYENLALDVEQFENKSVLILGERRGSRLGG